MTNFTWIWSVSFADFDLRVEEIEESIERASTVDDDDEEEVKNWS